MQQAVGVTPDRPILIDRFLHHATECEADAISDGENVFVPAVMEHIELAGIHSGAVSYTHLFREKGCKTAVFTFETAPGTLIRKKLQTMITTNEERYENLRDAGVDYLVEYPFNEQVASMSPEEFVAVSYTHLPGK